MSEFASCFHIFVIYLFVPLIFVYPLLLCGGFSMFNQCESARFHRSTNKKPVCVSQSHASVNNTVVTFVICRQSLQMKIAPNSQFVTPLFKLLVLQKMCVVEKSGGQSDPSRNTVKYLALGTI